MSHETAGLRSQNTGSAVLCPKQIKTSLFFIIFPSVVYEKRTIAHRIPLSGPYGVLTERETSNMSYVNMSNISLKLDNILIGFACYVAKILFFVLHSLLTEKCGGVD